jgi:hypothetical protein
MPDPTSQHYMTRENLTPCDMRCAQVAKLEDRDVLENVNRSSRVSKIDACPLPLET